MTWSGKMESPGKTKLEQGSSIISVEKLRAEPKLGDGTGITNYP